MLKVIGENSNSRLKHFAKYTADDFGSDKTFQTVYDGKLKTTS